MDEASFSNDMKLQPEDRNAAKKGALFSIKHRADEKTA
jgi:hypothetical protein